MALGNERWSRWKSRAGLRWVSFLFSSHFLLTNIVFYTTTHVMINSHHHLSATHSRPPYLSGVFFFFYYYIVQWHRSNSVVPLLSTNMTCSSDFNFFC